MHPDVLVVGQGLAGTLLAWELEQNGITFAIADPGHVNAATIAAAGIINPITGRRLVKSWRVDALLPVAQAAYRALEQALDVKLWTDVRIRRLFADARERDVLAAKQASGELAPFLGPADDEGLWIERAARIDLRVLLQAARERWRGKGWLRHETVTIAREVGRYGLVIDCRGLAGAQDSHGAFIPWEFSKGELIEVAIAGLAPNVVLNRRHWAAPIDAGEAWIGATHEPGNVDTRPTREAREMLEESARMLLGPSFAVTGQRAGVRVNLSDKCAAVGRHPENRGWGVLNALGAKGALTGPWLARAWADHLIRGATFDAAVDVRRFCGEK